MKNLIIQIIKQKKLVLIAFAFMIVICSWTLLHLQVDAVPDISPIQVVINTKTGALDPQQIEQTISFPIENEMNGISGVEEVRSLSKYGLSQVTVRFSDQTNIYWARQQVSERLQSLAGDLPARVTPVLGPITTGLGEVLMYTVLPKKNSALSKKSEKEQLLYLRTFQDLTVAPYLKRTVKGIAGIDSGGGFKKEIHIDLLPYQLNRYGLSIEEVAEKIETLGENFGGGYIQNQDKQIVVRSSGRLNDLESIQHFTIKLDIYGNPIRLSQIANVRIDHAQRLGAATYSGKEIVLGTVLMLNGSNSLKVAKDSESALHALKLPEDVEIKILYSRSYLVKSTIKTVEKNLLEGALFVIFVLFLILGNLRAALIVALAIPFSMLFTFLGMKLFNISASLMSLGAIDFGLLVDGSVVLVENILRKFKSYQEEMTSEVKMHLIAEAIQEVAKPVILGIVLISIVYVPILALEGIEGKLFRPMALTVMMALLSSLVVAILMVPIFVFGFIAKPEKEHESKFFSLIEKFYEKIYRFSFSHQSKVFILTLLFFGGAVFLFTQMGTNFMPALNEGDLVINLTRDAQMGIDRSVAIQKESERIISQFPQVEHVFSRMGTPESATDPMGVHLADTFVILKKDKKNISNKKKIYQEIKEALIKNEKSLGVQKISQTQPIEMRFNEILEGSRADVTLKIYGADLKTLIQLLHKSIALIEPIAGVEAVELDPLTALSVSPVFSAYPRSEAIIRYGLDIRRVNHLLQVAMSGETVGSYFENQWRFPIILKLAEEYREKPEVIRSLPVGLSAKGTIPFSQLADFKLNEEVTTIAHNRGVRYSAVAIYLNNRDIDSFVKELKNKLDKELILPPGYEIHFGGQFQNLERARNRLLFIIPLTLLVVFLVLMETIQSFKNALMILLSVPLAITGGILSLFLRGIPMSVSAAVGFIALIGIATLNALVLILFFEQKIKEGLPLDQAVSEAAHQRLRPILMTALVASLGFLPMALNTGIGAEVQRPLATVVIGGILSSTFLTLIVIPMLYLFVNKMSLSNNASES